VDSGVHRYLGRLTAEERRLAKRHDEVTRNLSAGDHHSQKLILISESGLYKLIMRSDKAEALAFQHWIASEVLPSIRKTGSYALADHGREVMPLPMDVVEAMDGATALA